MSVKPPLAVVNGDSPGSENPLRAALSRAPERVLPALVVLLTGAFALRRLDNTDTWFHLAAGRWIVAHGAIPTHDTLSWTVRDHPWINVQWLFDVLIYVLYDVGGPSLPVIVSAVFFTAAMALFLVNVLRHVGPITASLLATWAVIISQSRFEIRPEMLSYLLLQVILWLYATGRVVGRKRLWLLPAVMCLFANVHSLFVIGAVLIACYVAGTLLSGIPLLPSGWRTPVHPRVRTQVLATGGTALAATVLNPFLLKGALFPLVLMTEISGKQPFLRSIGELIRPFENYFVTFSLRAYRVLFFFALAVTLMALLVSAFRSRTSGVHGEATGTRAERRRRERMKRERAAPRSIGADVRLAPVIPHLDLGDVAVLVGVGYLSFLARRNIALLALAGGPPLASCLAVLTARVRGRVARGLLIRRAVAAVLALALIVGCWFVVSNGYYRWNNELHEFGLGVIPMCFPTRAAEFMKRQKLPPPMFNDFTNGGYFSWAEPIPGGVYVDGRGEVYGAEFLGRYGYLVEHPAEWQAEMDRRGVQTATLFHWWPNHQPLLRFLLNDRRWDVVFYDTTTVVAVRHEGNAETIARAALAFLAERDAFERSLLEPTDSWQWQFARFRGIRAYGNLLGKMGRSDEVRLLRQQQAILEQKR